MNQKFVTLDGLKIIAQRIKRLESMWKCALTNCKNCGAPVDCSVDACEYCGSPYEKMLNDKQDEIKIHEAKAVSNNCVYEWTVDNSGNNNLSIHPLHYEPTVDRSFLEYDRVQYMR